MGWREIHLLHLLISCWNRDVGKFSKLFNLKTVPFWPLRLLFVSSILVPVFPPFNFVVPPVSELSTLEELTYLAGSEHRQRLAHPPSKSFLRAYYVPSPVLGAWVHQWTKPRSLPCVAPVGRWAGGREYTVARNISSHGNNTNYISDKSFSS